MPKVVVAEDQVLKIHRVGDGPIWYLDGDKSARASDLGVHDFPDGEVALGSSRVRLLGTAENAALIARFYARKAQGRLRSVEVATPLVGASRAERGNGPLMLSRMRAFAWPASLGGWHEVTPIDYAAYLLATYFQHDIASPERVDQILDRHPLWRYVSFIPHVDRMRFARLMAIVLDPRWYCRGDEVADEFHPRDYVTAQDGDGRRLGHYLGLNPETFRAIRGSCGPARYESRCRTALAAWRTTTAPPREALEDKPGYFLWRRWRTYDSEVKADLRTSQLFIEFVRLCWLDVLYRDRHKGLAGEPDGLFAADHFFRRFPQEERAFLAHLGRRPRHAAG
jgi:hypothetical protein